MMNAATGADVWTMETVAAMRGLRSGIRQQVAAEAWFRFRDEALDHQRERLVREHVAQARVHAVDAHPGDIEVRVEIGEMDERTMFVEVDMRARWNPRTESVRISHPSEVDGKTLALPDAPMARLNIARFRAVGVLDSSDHPAPIADHIALECIGWNNTDRVWIYGERDTLPDGV